MIACSRCGDEKESIAFPPSLLLWLLGKLGMGCFLYEIWPGSRQGPDKKGRKQEGEESNGPGFHRQEL